MPHNIHELFRQVREHPDFVFGTIFVTRDFPDEQVPDDFPANRASDVLSEAGNALILDLCGDPERTED